MIEIGTSPSPSPKGRGTKIKISAFSAISAVKNPKLAVATGGY